MNKTTVAQQAKTASFLPPVQGILQRQCACGNHTVAGGECAGCAKNKSGLQRKLAIGASHDPLEREADRIADQVLAVPLDSAVRGAPPRIQRYAGQATEGTDTAPASVDRVLASSSRPLGPALQQDMEQRFGHDFSQVRVHTGAAAEQSAQDVNAHAYTVGHDIVFGASRFAPATADGRRLLAHELTHTVQSAPHVARQEAPQQAKCITGKQEGAGQNLKPTPISIYGCTYTYLIWGKWQAGDTANTFRSRILPKWVTWRFKGISAAERQAVIDYLQARTFVPFDATVLTSDCCYSLPLADGVVEQARALSGEAAREKAVKQAQEEQAGGGPGDAKDAAKQSPGGVAASGGTKEKIDTSDAGDPAGQKSVKVTGDPDVLAGNGPLAQLYLTFLGRYAGVKADRKQAEQGLPHDQVTAITKGNDRAKVVTDLFTQGWVEYRKAGGSDVVTFGFMEETLLTQRDRGNFTALHNQLEISKDPDGLGLYKRGTPLRYYDATGQPVPTNVGGYRDPGYRAAAPPAHALQIPITDRGLLQVLSGIKNVTLDDQILIYQSAKGYYDNGGLLWPAVRNGWNRWEELSAELKRQLDAVVFFLGLHGVATLLQKMQDPKAKGAGVLLEAMLKRAGKFFQFTFAVELADLLLTCGLELSKIQRPEGSSELDVLSQQHLERAALQMRQLLVLLLAAGLTAALVEKARHESVTLGPPKGGGGGLVPAPAGARAGVPQGGAAAVPAPPPYRPPYGTPVPPSQLESRGSGSGDATKKTDQPKDPAKAADKPAGDKSALRDQAKTRLEELQTEKAQTQKEIDRLENERHEAAAKVNRLRKQALDSPVGSEAHAKALEEFKAAEEKLARLDEKDALGGFKEESSKQSKAEEAILESLGLKRPSLWESTMAAIKKAAKKNSAGKFLDANTNEVIEGEPVYGHIKGREHRRLALKAFEKGMTQEQFTKWVNDHPQWFQTETKANNESHAYEQKGIAGWEQIE